MFSAESSHISFSVALVNRKDWRMSCHAIPPQKKHLIRLQVFMAVLNQSVILLLAHVPFVLKFLKNVHTHHYHYELTIRWRP